MDKKIRHRILYITVAALWLVAIYRTYKNYQVSEENEITTVVNAPAISPIQFGKDTFELELPDHDPFLQRSWTPVVSHVETAPQEKPKTEVKKPVEKPIAKIWPQIEYFGFVKNRNQNSTLCLLKIDGKKMQLTKGQSYNGLTVQQVYKDSLIVAFEGDFRTIRK